MTDPKTERQQLLDSDWLRTTDKLLFERLLFKSISENIAPAVEEHNLQTRNKVYETIKNNETIPIQLADLISEEEADDITISEIDRYGLPFRTVINQTTGLIRTDPYFSQEWLSSFYKNFYRDLYSNKNSISHSSLLAEQIKRGEYYFGITRKFLDDHENILEIGCGMGGILIPFKLAGFDVKGIDLGDEYIMIGRQFNLDLSVESITDIVAKKEKYSFIILSHLIEHIPDLHTFFINLKEILSENGKVFITVPGIKSMHKTYDNDLQIYLQNAHCWAFSKNTLSAFLNKMGFRIDY
ncbi:MAG: class I SAM-dependent methyltransferase, partial [Bacteroidota bacterium]|nr:class I SAM-dependent methyltransferase [Bacteroidota bacterium]